jgi:glycosyltransferase involved in cell wall biosynthesis
LILPRLNAGVHFWFLTYGDFILPNPTEWLHLNPYLMNHYVGFIHASDRHRDFVDQFLIQKDISQVCPFPVNDEEFGFKRTSRHKLRTLLKIEKEFVWLYSGRLSQQKNIIQLIQSFARYKSETGCDDKLFLAGSFDKMGIPYLGFQYQEHEYYYHFQTALSQLDPKIQQDIHLLGQRSAHDLEAIYCMADAFVSLSTHNDEDYGMAVAEAMCSGLPCILSNWAGYSSFAHYSDKVSLIKIRLNKKRLEYDEKKLIHEMIKLRSMEVDREVEATKCREKIGVKAVSRLLNTIFEKKLKKFDGFGKGMHELSLVWSNNSQFGDSDEGYNNFYKKIYHVYYR